MSCRCLWVHVSAVVEVRYRSWGCLWLHEGSFVSSFGILESAIIEVRYFSWRFLCVHGGSSVNSFGILECHCRSLGGACGCTEGHLLIVRASWSGNVEVGYVKFAEAYLLQEL